MRFGRIGGALFIAWVTACDGPSVPAVDAGIDAGHQQNGSDARPVCVRDRDCDDGRFCNGAEHCVPGAAEASSDGCVAAESPPCDETQRCDEATSSCQSTECDDGGDADGDGDKRPECGGDDCDDGDPRVYSTATEVCPLNDPVLDALNEDCDPLTIHDDDPVSGDGELDGDGAIANRCVNTRDDGTENRGSDCDDTHDSIHPGAVEDCNGFDDDCDERVDEGVRRTYYADADGDSYGVEEDTFEACGPPDGYSLMAGDCDDGVTQTHPGGTEVCNEVDDDCDDMIDEEGATGAMRFYRDRDGDGYGTSEFVEACSMPAGYAEVDGDCFDSRGAISAEIHPDADFQPEGYCRVGSLCSIGSGTSVEWHCGRLIGATVICSVSDPLALWDFDCSGSVEVQHGSTCWGGCGGACICSGGSLGPTTVHPATDCGHIVYQVTGCGWGGSSCGTAWDDLPLRCR